jgi:nicotinamide-nucleotide amidase
VVTYSNESKSELLGVPKALINAHGAVSAEVAEAMATGMLARAPVDWAIAVTGIAGPGGGSAEKPVGTVWLALSGRSGCGASASMATAQRCARKRLERD